MQSTRTSCALKNGFFHTKEEFHLIKFKVNWTLVLIYGNPVQNGQCEKSCEINLEGAAKMALIAWIDEKTFKYM